MSLFQNSEINKCIMRFKRPLVNTSDAVILTSWKGLDIGKGPRQVWIMIQWESTQMHATPAQTNAPVYAKNKINCTMSYSKNADIYLPYGRLRQLPKERRPHWNYFQIAKSISKDAVWVVSHCNRYSRRETYVEILKQYISVDILGGCGEKWDCGRRLINNECFDMLNTTYRYYLAFENSIRQEYITEKFFENYKYYILQVVRGDKPSNRPINISQEAYIRANDFKNAYELGNFLKELSSNPNRYASMLRKKDEYEVVPYIKLFQDASCEICKRLQSVEKYPSVYTEVYQWILENESCFELDDIYTLL